MRRPLTRITEFDAADAPKPRMSTVVEAPALPPNRLRI